MITWKAKEVKKGTELVEPCCDEIYRRSIYLPADTTGDLSVGDEVTITLKGKLTSLREDEMGGEITLDLDSYELED